MNDHQMLATRSAAIDAREEGRPHNTEESPMGTATRRGVIEGAANANGTYNVRLVAASGALTELIRNVPAWGATFEDGAQISLVFEPSRKIPWIQGGGGSGSGGDASFVVVGESWFLT